MQVSILLLSLSFAFISFSAFAQNFDARVKQAYLTNDQNVDLDCFYYNPSRFKWVSSEERTQVEDAGLKRRFELNSSNAKMSFELRVYLNEEDKVRYSVSFENGEKLSGRIDKVKEREFYLHPTSNREFNQNFEISKLFCAVNFAKEAPLPLKTEKIHLNVHPHTRYDYLNLTSSKVEEYLEDGSFKSHILLEEGNFKGNLVDLDAFIKGGAYQLPQNFYPSDLNPPRQSSLVVSPAGHNRFVWQSDQDLQVLYTGGNHNYCIWNNTRNLLYAYLRSPNEGRIEIQYDTQAIVAQRKGIIGGLSFPWREHRKSNLLVDLFQNPKTAIKYHKNYFQYFSADYIAPFKGLFSSLKISYAAQGFEQTKVIKGQGSRELEIVIRYL